MSGERGWAGGADNKTGEKCRERDCPYLDTLVPGDPEAGICLFQGKCETRGMTNFEKWKNELTPEKLMYGGFHAGEPYKAAVFKCSQCPAEKCPRKDTGCLIHDAICEEEFLKWAAGAECEKKQYKRPF